MANNFETYTPDVDRNTTGIDTKNIIEENNLNTVFDVPILLSAVLGRTRLSIAEIINLSEGSVLDLEKAIGEPVDIYINNQKIARGELILVEDELCISLSEIFDSL